MSFLSTRCLYGLRAALYVAAGMPDRNRTSVRDIAHALDIPHFFLAKIVQALTTAGILRAVRGRGGGVELARAPHAITLLEVIVALDGDGVFRSCVLGLAGCSDRRPCPLHAKWSAKRKALKRLFASSTLAQIAKLTHIAGIRLSD